MSVEIHQPEIEALIQQRMASGAFQDVEEVLLYALKSAPYPPVVQSEDKSLIDLFEPVRGLLTDAEVDTLFSRSSSVSRPIDLS